MGDALDAAVKDATQDYFKAVVHIYGTVSDEDGKELDAKLGALKLAISARACRPLVEALALIASAENRVSVSYLKALAHDALAAHRENTP